GYLFKCVASSASPCTVTSESNPATLTVNETTITTQPASLVTICGGESTSYTVVASGNGLTYQWYVSNIAITDGGEYSGATTATLSITGATTALNGALYYCVVNGSCTAVTSNYSSLQVNGVDKPIISADFSNPSSPYLYVSNVFGDTYEWFLNGSLYSNTYEIYADQAGSYTVIVSSQGCSSVASDAQVIIVTDVEKDILSKVQAYPNPVADNLIIRLAQKDENTIIRVLSIDGRVEISQYANELENTINMAHLSEGAYLVQIINVEKTLTYKVIKQ
ncbi:MAG: T9SS type A sorting domain-containing protein, partial [Cyclobacteriaceae bacterium]|nr:T9SS type A sorting domain-containing protein [Cyclobacteriaceae bacterium]